MTTRVTRQKAAAISAAETGTNRASTRRKITKETLARVYHEEDDTQESVSEDDSDSLPPAETTLNPFLAVAGTSQEAGVSPSRMSSLVNRTSPTSRPRLSATTTPVAPRTAAATEAVVLSSSKKKGKKRAPPSTIQYAMPSEAWKLLDDDMCNLVRLALFDGRGVTTDVKQSGIDFFVRSLCTNLNFGMILNDPHIVPPAIYKRCLISRVVITIQELRKLKESGCDEEDEQEVFKYNTDIMNQLSVINNFLKGDIFDPFLKNSTEYVELLPSFKLYMFIAMIGAGKEVEGVYRPNSRAGAIEKAQEIFSLSSQEKNGLDRNHLQELEARVQKHSEQAMDEIENGEVNPDKVNFGKLLKSLSKLVQAAYTESFKDTRPGKSTQSRPATPVNKFKGPLLGSPQGAVTNPRSSQKTIDQVSQMPFDAYEEAEPRKRAKTTKTERMAPDGDRRMKEGAPVKRRERSTRNKWTQEETDALAMGMSELGVNWVGILARYPILHQRTNVQLKDRARTMKKTLLRQGVRDLGVWALATGNFPED